MSELTADAAMLSFAEYSDASAVPILQRFFKTAPGQYGEGDQFIGVTVPDTRKVAKQFRSLSLTEIQKLFGSPVHEHRLCAAIILTLQFPRATSKEQQQIYEFYLQNVHQKRINNWDLVDVSAEHIIGKYLQDKPRDILFILAQDENLWTRRVAIMGTFHFIKNNDATTTLQIAEKLLHDKHDLIHKAVGWMLREVGKRVDELLLLNFLDKHAHEMPRTMLRYSIERLTSEQKQHYMERRSK